MDYNAVGAVFCSTTSQREIFVRKAEFQAILLGAAQTTAPAGGLLGPSREGVCAIVRHAYQLGRLPLVPGPGSKFPVACFESASGLFRPVPTSQPPTTDSSFGGRSVSMPAPATKCVDTAFGGKVLATITGNFGNMESLVFTSVDDARTLTIRRTSRHSALKVFLLATRRFASDNGLANAPASLVAGGFIF